MGGNANGICRPLALIVFQSVDTWAENLVRLYPDDYGVLVRGGKPSCFVPVSVRILPLASKIIA